MDSPPTEITALLDGIDQIADPVDRARAAQELLRAIPDIQRRLRAARQEAVVALRGAGHSHADIGTVLGISRGRAQQIAEGRTR
ncbi:hypothetical protein GCM10017673_38200 [Streptosporangium violaceochromogenes]|nr:hypothetical protein GCM10017673_38200 [Streptosporangium violaceochromogenes]